MFRFSRQFSSLVSRDIFVIDHKLKLDEWKLLGSLGSQALKHPASNHVVSQYLSQVHLHSNYCFNSVGENNIYISPAIRCKKEADLQQAHTVLFYPDGVCCHNLNERTIPEMVDIILRKNLKTSSLCELLAKVGTLEYLPKITIVIAMPKGPHSPSARLINWFTDAIAGTKLEGCTEIIQTTDFDGGGAVKIFPFDDCFADFVSFASVKAVIDKYLTSI